MSFAIISLRFLIFRGVWVLSPNGDENRKFSKENTISNKCENLH